MVDSAHTIALLRNEKSDEIFHLHINCHLQALRMTLAIRRLSCLLNFLGAHKEQSVFRNAKATK